VPDSIRASEASNAGQKSFEHLIGIFEGSSPLENEFLKGPKTETRLLATYYPARASALFALLAKNHTWQCTTLVWERGGNLIDQTDFARYARARYVPAYWKDVTWKRFTDEIKRGFDSDDLSTRERFVAKELEVVKAMHDAGIQFLAGTDTAPGVYIFPGFSLHEELHRFVAAGFTPNGGATNRHAESSKIPRTRRPSWHRRKRQDRRPCAAGRRSPRGHSQYTKDRCRDREWPLSLTR
jgi:hypothetical protein